MLVSATVAITKCHAYYTGRHVMWKYTLSYQLYYRWPHLMLSGVIASK